MRLPFSMQNNTTEERIAKLIRDFKQSAEESTNAEVEGDSFSFRIPGRSGETTRITESTGQGGTLPPEAQGYAPFKGVEAVLTLREQQITQAIVDGRTNRDIADRFGITEQVVKNHLTSIFEKVGVENRLQLGLALVRRS